MRNLDEKLKKKTLALSVAAAVVVASPLYQEGKLVTRLAKADETKKVEETEKDKKDKFYKAVVEKFEKGDAYHGTGEEPFMFSTDKEQEGTTHGGHSSSMLFLRGRSFSSDSWRSWTSGDNGVYHYSSDKGGSSLS